MKITLRTLLDDAAVLALEERDIARLAQLEGTPAEEALAKVSKAAVQWLRRCNDEVLGQDLTSPHEHNLTISGQILGLQAIPSLIAEAGATLRESQQQEAQPQ